MQEVRAGGSTVCVAALWPRRTLRTANLGDSGCLVVRGGECVFRAEERVSQHPPDRLGDRYFTGGRATITHTLAHFHTHSVFS